MRKPKPKETFRRVTCYRDSKVAYQETLTTAEGWTRSTIYERAYEFDLEYDPDMVRIEIY